MPFIRQTRDKRGFDHTSVMHTYHPGAAGPQRPRVLYVFRSPANLKVGRTALDAEVMEALEHTHPDLNFDWAVLTRDAVVSRVEPPVDHRQSRRPPPRSAERPPRPAERPARPAPEPPAAPLPPDDSRLGLVLGAAEAARLRRRYSDLVQRVARRASTPEERDRLIERARRLNPDEWPDEAAIRAQTPGVDAAWDAISAELPSRRRGRRGGRRRLDEERAPSGIMAGETPATGEAVHEIPEVARADGAGHPGRDVGPVGAATPGPDAEETGTEPDVPVGD